MMTNFELDMITRLMKNQELQLKTLERILNILEFIAKDKEIEK